MTTVVYKREQTYNQSDQQSCVVDSGQLHKVDKLSKGYRFIKRVFDILFSTLVVVCCIVPCLGLSIAIMFDTKGSPIYTQERVSKFGKPFKIYKFRTMVADSDDIEKYFDEGDLAVWHREHKVQDDPRITQLGAFLRETSLDELPQFINVIKGEMSVVGPRPITQEELRNFDGRVDELLSRRPGITGWWQTQSRNQASYETGERQELELYYIKHAGYAIDLRIIKDTFTAMIHRTGK